MNKYLLITTLFLSLNANAYELASLGLCRDIDGTLRPLEKLLCESTAAMLETMNPTLRIPACSDREGPQVLSGDKPVSAVFISCTLQSILSCKNIASSIMENQPGVTVNILVTSKGLANEKISSTLLNLVSAAQKNKSPINILPINAVPDRANIAYMRDPGVFTKDANSKTTFTALPYVNQGIPGTVVMNEGMKWCGIEQVDTYKNLASFDTAYNALVYDQKKFPNHSETMARELTGAGAVNDFTTQNSTMGGNILALPNGTIVTGHTSFSKMNNSVIDYFSKTKKVLEVELPDLNVGHIDEVINFVPANNSCGYTILQSSPAEAVKYLDSIKSSKDPFLAFFDMHRFDLYPEKRKIIQDKLKPIQLEKIKYFQEKKELPIEIVEAEKELLEELTILNGANDRTPEEILKDERVMSHWKKIEAASNNVTKVIIAELKRTNPSCTPEVVKLPVFFDMTMPRPLIPNPVNGLAVNGSYFRSTSKGDVQKRDVPESRRSYVHLEKYIDQKLDGIFPQGIHLVDTVELNDGGGNFHCATTNIYLPCKP